MRLPGYLIAFMLAVLLASTTPVGTGAGTHQFDLLHPLFAHLHLVDGRWLTHEQLAQRVTPVETRTSPGPALGAGNSAGSADGALGIGPIAPGEVFDIRVTTPVEFVLQHVRTPSGNVEAPPDPPPL